MTPQEEYLNAINFDKQKEEPINFVNYLKQLNNKTFIYPILILILFVIVLIIILFQKNVPKTIKIVLSSLYATALIYTGYTFWPNL